MKFKLISDISFPTLTAEVEFLNGDGQFTVSVFWVNHMLIIHSHEQLTIDTEFSMKNIHEAAGTPTPASLWSTSSTSTIRANRSEARRYFAAKNLVSGGEFAHLFAGEMRYSDAELRKEVELSAKEFPLEKYDACNLKVLALEDILNIGVP